MCYILCDTYFKTPSGNLRRYDGGSIEFGGLYLTLLFTAREPSLDALLKSFLEKIVPQKLLYKEKWSNDPKEPYAFQKGHPREHGEKEKGANLDSCSSSFSFVNAWS